MKPRTTLSDIARKVGVSPRAVSSALHGGGRVSEEVRQRVKTVAEELGYRPNIMARGLLLKRTYLLGAVFPYVAGSFYAKVLQGIEDRALMAGYRVVICSAGWNAQVEANHLADLISRGVDGLILVPRPDMPAIYEELRASKLPLVQVFNCEPSLAGPSIQVRNEEGAYKATLHLIRTRRVRPYHFPGDPYTTEGRERLAGFRRAIEDSGFAYDERECVYPDPITEWEQGRRALRALHMQQALPQALFAVNDYAALGALRAAHELGLSVPRDLSIVGYDDLDVSSMQASTALTTMRQPQETVGELAVQMLLDLIADRSVTSVELSPELVVRET